MERIVELMNFYREKGNGRIVELVSNFSLILRSSNKDEAEKAAMGALEILEEVATRKDHIAKLKSFLYDLSFGGLNIQPLM